MSIAYDTLEDQDMLMYIKMCVLLYAHDTIIMAENINDLQKALNGMSDYWKLWMLNINSSTSEILIFSRGK